MLKSLSTEQWRLKRKKKQLCEINGSGIYFATHWSTAAIFFISKFVSVNCENVYYRASFDCPTRNFGIFTVPGYIATVKRDRINQELLTLLKPKYLLFLLVVCTCHTSLSLWWVYNTAVQTFQKYPLRKKRKKVDTAIVRFHFGQRTDIYYNLYDKIHPGV